MSQASRADAVASISNAATYDGFFLRDNLASEGAVPAAPPYNQCPDIIQSLVPLPDPEAALGAPSSWERAYRTEPLPGMNYYYARGLNGTSATFDGKMALYWCPAELGFHTELTVQYWNTSGKVPDDGSHLTLTANYVIRKAQLDEALTAGIVDSRYSRNAANLVSATGATVTPTPVAPLGAVTFIATSAG
jgi:hypothetical protein